jgi:hypothetical protein
MSVNRYQGLAIAIALVVVGKALVALVRLLVGAGE